MDQTHVTFRWKDVMPTAGAPSGYRAWSSYASSRTSYREGFTRSDTSRAVAPSKRDSSNRAWVLLILATPADPARPLKVTSLSEVLSQLMELTDQALNEVPNPDAELPRCPLWQLPDAAARRISPVGGPTPDGKVN